MRGVKHGDEVRTECFRLRREERLSLKEISLLTGISKGTLSFWLRNEPLTAEELKTRRYKTNRTRYKDRGKESPLHRMFGHLVKTRQQKAKIAEAAVLVRLSLLGTSVYGSPFDGDKFDWLVHLSTGEIKRVQVRWAGENKQGLPNVSLQCYEGHSDRRRYQEGELDIIVAYDFFTDSCFVWTYDELAENKTVVTITEEALERWDKLAGEV